MSTDPAKSGLVPDRTWVTKTDEDGYTELGDKYFVSGDSFYRHESGGVTIPYGTVTVQETKAPTGYKLDDKIYVVQIKDDDAGMIGHLNLPDTIKEKVTEIKIVKTQDGTNLRLPNVVFELTYRDKHKETATTNAKGEAWFKGLPEGSYTLREKSTTDGYLVNSTTVTFTVDANHNVVKGEVHSKNDATSGTVTFTQDKDLNAVIAYEDTHTANPLPY